MSESVQITSRRILIFRIGELGDTLIALPSFQLVREHFPTAHIALLSNLNSREKHVTPDQVLPEGIIDELITYPSSSSGTRGFEMLQLLRTLRNASFDLLVYLAPRVRNSAAVRRDLLFFKLAGIRRFVGVEGLAPLPRKSKGTALPSVTHEADHLLARLASSGLGTPVNGKAQFHLQLTHDELSAAHHWMTRKLSRPGDALFVGVGPGSKWPSKVWPQENFAELGKRLFAGNSRLYPIVCGGATDHALGEQLVSNWGRGANAAGQLTPRESAAVLSQCAFYVGNDTGTMHLAASVNTPCVAIMSAQDWPGRWNPYGPQHLVLRKEVECEGCQLTVCETENLRCLTSISVDEVVAACRQIESATRSELVPQLA